MGTPSQILRNARDLHLDNWRIHTTQLSDRTIKHWFARSAMPEHEGTRPLETRSAFDEVAWTPVDMPDGLGCIVVDCMLVIGLIETFRIGDTRFDLRNWVYLPPRGRSLGQLVVLLPAPVDRGAARDDLVITTSFETIIARPGRGPDPFPDLPLETRNAILLLAAGEALADPGGPLHATWPALLAASRLITDPETLPPFRARLAIRPHEIEIDGVIHGAVWPITLLDGPQGGLLRPALLQTTTCDDDGDIAFRLTVRAGAPAPQPRFLLATDGIYRLVQSA